MGLWFEGTAGGPEISVPTLDAQHVEPSLDAVLGGRDKKVIFASSLRRPTQTGHDNRLLPSLPAERGARDEETRAEVRAPGRGITHVTPSALPREHLRSIVRARLELFKITQTPKLRKPPNRRAKRGGRGPWTTHERKITVHCSDSGDGKRGARAERQPNLLQQCRP